MLRLPLSLTLGLFTLQGCALLGQSSANNEQQQMQIEMKQQQQVQREQTKQLVSQNEQLIALADEHKTTQQQLNQKIEKLELDIAELSKQNTQLLKILTPAKKTLGTGELAATPSPRCAIGDKMVVGEEEWLYIPAVNEYFEARIDSGATTSSISAKNLEQFERDGKRWVRFDLEHKEGEEGVKLERPIERRVAIKQSSADEKESRPVISLLIKMGDYSENTEFTLADRSQMNYPVLLGRSFLRDIMLIDVSKTYLQPRYQTKSTENAPSIKAIQDKDK